ncbi:MAG: 50S ribosomal protein L11 methyltransferase, partial [Methyloceanibacter sp.]
MSEASLPGLYRAIVEVGQSDAMRIAQILDEAEHPQSVSVSTFDVGPGRFEISALYNTAPDRNDLQALINAAATDRSASPLRIEVVPDADWVTISQGQRGPVRAGRFLIHGSHDRGRIARNRYTIEIDADQAFGTAHHATTLGCLFVLDELAKWGRPNLVLDVGTGTGVLAIAAALAFDRAVIATDNDPVAVRIAQQNAAKAHISQS